MTLKLGGRSWVGATSGSTREAGWGLHAVSEARAHRTAARQERRGKKSNAFRMRARKAVRYVGPIFIDTARNTNVGRIAAWPLRENRKMQAIMVPLADVTEGDNVEGLSAWAVKARHARSNRWISGPLKMGEGAIESLNSRLYRLDRQRKAVMIRASLLPGSKSAGQWLSVAITN